MNYMPHTQQFQDKEVQITLICLTEKERTVRQNQHYA